MNTETLPPGQDLKELIRAEHDRAELQRLKEGIECCGCDVCQELYRELDMAQYGSRVLTVDNWITVKAAPPKPKTQPDDEWIHSDLIYCLDGLAWGITLEGKSIILGNIADVERHFINKSDAIGLRPGAVEVLDRIKEWESNQYGTRTIPDKVVRACNQRGGLVQSAKRNKVNDRQPALQQRFAIL